MPLITRPDAIKSREITQSEREKVKKKNDFKNRGFPSGSAGKESTCNSGDLSLTPGLGRSPGEGKGYPRQYSGLDIPWTIYFLRAGFMFCYYPLPMPTWKLATKFSGATLSSS